MESIVKLCNLILGFALHAAVFDAAALSLGNSRGAVQLGAPIDLFFEIQPDAGVSLAESCIKAQLVSGEVPVGSSKVQVLLLPELPGRPSMVRVHAAAIVDEPVLTATITAGCSGSTSRTYTFLTQVPEAVARAKVPVDVARLAEVAPAAMTTGVPLAPTLPRVAAERAQRSKAQAPVSLSRPIAQEDESGAPRPTVRVPKPSQDGVSPRPAAAIAKKAAPVVPQAEGRSPPARKVQSGPVSRLVMEPLDLSADAPMPALRATDQMAVLPAKTPASAREQAAATWKALSADPQDMASRDGERVQALEAQLSAMQAKAAQERSAVAELRDRLEAMEQERYASSWVYGLGVLLALALAGMAWMWMRLRESQLHVERSWRDSVALAAAHDKALDEHYGESTPRDTWLDSDSSLPQELPAQRVQVTSAPVAPAAAVVSPVALAPVPKVVTAAEPVAAAVNEPKLASIVNLADLFDILQQAEFFVSVGEHDEAIELLQKHIADRGKQSPFAYLELLRLYHQLGRADDYEQLRAQFLRYFNAQLPAYSQFDWQGCGLDHYVDALAEIEAQWTSSSVLALLEGYLFLRDGVPPTHPAFDPAAYDDLLLLLAIAQTTPASGRGAPPPRTRTTPFAVFAAAALPHVERVSDWGTVADTPPDTISTKSMDSLVGDLALVPSMDAGPVHVAQSEAVLDLDLSDVPLILMPSVDENLVPKPQASGKAVGFGSTNDKIEFSFELEPQIPKKE
jgi:pilus assembly protein FimV